VIAPVRGWWLVGQNPKFEEARPVLVCVARDVPVYAKTRMYDLLCAEMSGVFIRATTPRFLGLDIPHMQAILSAGYSVVTDVDAGLTAATRREFISAVAIAKKALVPSPQVVLVLGNNENPGVDVLSGEKRHFGISDDDMKALRDQGLKRRLERAQECLLVLTGGAHKMLIENLSRLEKPPCTPYIIVMEAMAILFTPGSTFRSPQKNMAAASWFTVKRCTAPYQQFCDRVRGVNKYAIPPANLLILEEYLAHHQWPRGRELSPVGGTGPGHPHVRNRR
jgi:hypothetical protein